MTYKTQFTALLLLAFALSASAQLSSPLTRLETEYRRTRAEALQQLNTRYITSLEALKRSQMGQNDLAGANASQALIDELKAENAALGTPKLGQATPSGSSTGSKGSLLGQTITTFPAKVYLDNGRHKEKEVTFKLEQGLLRKARLVVTFEAKNRERKTSTAGGIFIFRPGTPLKKVGEWTSRDSKKGEFSCDILNHLAEPGEYKLRFTTTADGGESLEAKIRLD